MNFENLNSINDLIKFCKENNWQDFEKLVSFIFEKNGFLVDCSIVKVFNKKKRQYDVIAKDNEKVVLVDCKKWAGNRYKSSALKTAVKKHLERCEFYKNFTEKEVIPLIVTEFQEDILFFEDVPIVPVEKLNRFLGEN